MHLRRRSEVTLPLCTNFSLTRDAVVARRPSCTHFLHVARNRVGWCAYCRAVHDYGINQREA